MGNRMLLKSNVRESTKSMCKFFASVDVYSNIDNKRIKTKYQLMTILDRRMLANHLKSDKMTNDF